jgi:hypothetical protein
MPIVVADHHLKDFDAWFSLFKESPPPAAIARWRVLRGTADRNHVRVVGEVDAAQVAEVERFFASEKMQAIFAQVNEMSTAPMEITWLEDVTPG